MVKHHNPAYNAKSFDCPHCGAYAQQYKVPLNALPTAIYEELGRDIGIMKCLACEWPSLWYKEILIFPIPTASIELQPSPDMPEDVAEDFKEARAVLPYSPRSSAALLRLALEKLCIHLELPGKNLNEHIASLVKQGLSPKVQKAFDIVRVIGNNAVHPGSIDLRDDQQSALSLFDLLNLIVEQMITLPRMVEETYQNLPQGARDQIVQRDGAKA